MSRYCRFAVQVEALQAHDERAFTRNPSLKNVTGHYFARGEYVTRVSAWLTESA
jgi:hypothetical protein